MHQVDDAPDDVGVGVASWQVHDKGLVDLDQRDRQVAQICERGKAGAEVIDGQSEACRG